MFIKAAPIGTVDALGKAGIRRSNALGKIPAATLPEVMRATGGMAARRRDGAVARLCAFFSRFRGLQTGQARPPTVAGSLFAGTKQSGRSCLAEGRNQRPNRRCSM